MWKIFVLIISGVLILNAIRGLFVGEITAFLKPLGFFSIIESTKITREESAGVFMFYVVFYLALGSFGLYLLATQPELFVATPRKH